MNSSMICYLSNQLFLFFYCHLEDGNNWADVSSLIKIDKEERSLPLNPSDFFPDDIDLAIELCDPITNLMTHLKNSITGIAVLNYFKIQRCLTETYRVLLADCIVTREMQTNYDHIISPERMKELSSLIVKLFPTEIIATYYVPYSRVGKKKILARGKLQVRYTHYRDYLLLSGASRNLRGIKRKAVDESTPVRIGTTAEIFKIDTAAGDCEKKLEWLKEHIDPWTTVEEFWRSTSAARIQNLISNQALSSSEYINSVPALTHIKNGLKLIGIDFDVVYPHKTSNLENTYDNLERQILLYCSKKKRAHKDIKILVSLLNKYKDKDHDTRSAIIFKLIPLLLPNPPVIVSQNGSWHPKKEEVQNYFLLHAKDDNELCVKLVERKNQLLKYGLTEQPLPVLIGAELTSIEKRLVIVNDIRYEADSNIECVDYCFKSYFALQLEYSKESSYPWMFLQEAIYKIDTEDRITVPALDTFIRDLNLA
ncbi:uncharacterized protein LOC141535594 [Cotesia typhae]|uniref:uncharacterized protein LOC141535594 n=1 Tax=Cotesia typhae TaxID=2053667 RepID=UPI003D687E8F